MSVVRWFNELVNQQKSILVDGFSHLEKYQSMGRIIPYIMENKTCIKMFQTTNQYCIKYCIDGYLWLIYLVKKCDFP